MKSEIRQESMITSAGKVSGATFISRILGLIREQVTAYLFGAGNAVDAFKSAFRIPNLLRDLFAEGALSAGFVPIFSEKLKLSGREAAIRFASLVFGALLVIVAAVVLALIWLSPELVSLIAGGFEDVAGKVEETILLSRVMMPFLLLISLASMLMGVLNSLGRFGLPALAPALFNVAMILTALLVTPWVNPPILSLAIGVLLGGLLQFGLQYLYLFRIGFRFGPVFQFLDRDLLRMLLLILPMTVGLAASQINVAVVTRIASSEPGAVSYLDYAFRLLHLPLGLFAVAIATVVLPRLSGEAAGGNATEFSRIHSQAIRLGAFLSLPAMVVMILLAEDICGGIYQYGRFSAQDAAATGRALAFYSIGLPFFTLVRITVPAFYAQKDTRTPALVAVSSVLVNVLLCLELRHYLGFAGLALAAALAGAVNITLLTVLLRRKTRISEDSQTILVLAKILASAGAMALLLFVLRPLLLTLGSSLLPNHLIGLALLLLIGLTSFLIMSYLLRIEELQRFGNMMRARFRK
ncbi:MAG: murein biosynthesis integral membrane protein MurJ [bacterium]